MTTWTITDMQARVATSYLGGDRDGVYARVELDNGDALDLSRLDGETGWTADAAWGKGSFPRWANGYGARYLITKEVTDAALVAALDERARELKLFAILDERFDTALGESLAADEPDRSFTERPGPAM